MFHHQHHKMFWILAMTFMLSSHRAHVNSLNSSTPLNTNFKPLTVTGLLSLPGLPEIPFCGSRVFDAPVIKNLVVFAQWLRKSIQIFQTKIQAQGLDTFHCLISKFSLCTTKSRMESTWSLELLDQLSYRFERLKDEST